MKLKSMLTKNACILATVFVGLVLFASCKPETGIVPPAPTYTVAYSAVDADSGDVPVDEGTYKEGETITVFGNTEGLAKAGNGFAGWTVNEDGTGEIYGVYGSTAYTMPASNVTFYAKWQLNTYTVSFVTGEGTAVPTQTVSYGATATNPQDDPAREGYSFEGWYSDANCTAGNETNFAAGVTGDVTYYAKWKVNNYKVTFDANGGSGSEAPKTLDYGSSFYPSASGIQPPQAYQFVGWSTDKDATVGSYTDSLAYTVPAHDSTLYAIYACEYTYTVANDEVTITGFSSYGGKTTGAYVIPSSIKGLPVTAIGTSAFNSKTQITGITIPGSVRTIGGNAFSSLTAFKSVSLSSGLQTIGEYAFADCKALTSLTLPDSVTRLDEYAFLRCSKLASLDLGNGLVEIMKRAFSGCSSITTLSLPASCVTVSSSAFSEMTGMTAFSVEDGNQAFSAIDGVLVYTWGTYVIHKELFSYPQKKTASSYTVPSDITDIEDKCFANNQSLTSVTLQEGVVTIGANAFNGCTSLASITLPESLTAIYAAAFTGCSALTSIYIPSKMTVTLSGSSQFEGCTALETITVSADNPTYSVVDGVLFSKDKTRLYMYPIGKTGTSYAVPSGVTNIYSGAFYQTKLSSITLAETVAVLYDHAFRYMTNLTSITIPDSVTSINHYAFYGCTSLTAITVNSDSVLPAITNTAITRKTGLEIRVPSTLVDAFKADTAKGWSYYADYIVSQ
jgi:uncharacterized repeat protein (TIGR02543 family)